MSEDLIKLYSDRILALAATIPHSAPLEKADGSAQSRSPLCGSMVAASVQMKADEVAALSLNVKACALGQAAASVVGAQAIGATRADFQRGRDQLHMMLTKSGPVPDAPWQDLEVMRPAVEFPNRHPSILLAFDAILDAIDDASRA